MLRDPDSILKSFMSDVARYYDLDISDNEMWFDSWKAPHKAKDLPIGFCSVYIFSLSDNTVGSAGEGKVIKVGKVGFDSNPRFRYQHYKEGSANSTLAAAVRNNPLLWNYVGYSDELDDVGEWLRQYTDRNNYYFKEKYTRDLFEVYAKAVYGPVYEGSLSGIQYLSDKLKQI